MNVTMTERPEEQVTVLTLRGELGADSTADVQSALAELLRRSAIRIVVDVSQLTFCDSIGLSTFVVAHHACRTANGFVRLAAPSKFLLRVLAVVGLLDRIPVYDTVPAACTGDESQLTVSPLAPEDGPATVDR